MLDFLTLNGLQDLVKLLSFLRFDKSEKVPCSSQEKFYKKTGVGVLVVMLHDAERNIQMHTDYFTLLLYAKGRQEELDKTPCALMARPS